MNNITNLVNEYVLKQNIHNKEFFNDLKNIEFLAVKSNQFFFESKLKILEIKDKSCKKNILEQIELANNYSRYMNYEIDFDEIVSSGVLDFSARNEAFNRYEANGFKTVYVNSNNSVFNSAILVHELSHLYNQPDDKRSDFNDMFTETLAYCDTLLYADFLKNEGYETDYLIIKNDICDKIVMITNDMIPFIRLININDLYGKVTKEDYIDYYGDDNFEHCKEVFLNNCEDMNFKYALRYVLGLPLSIVMYQKYRGDLKFQLNDIHKSFDGLDYKEFLKMIDYDANKINIIREFFDSVKLENEKYKEGELNEYFSAGISR